MAQNTVLISVVFLMDAKGELCVPLRSGVLSMDETCILTMQFWWADEKKQTPAVIFFARQFCMAFVHMN